MDLFRLYIDFFSLCDTIIGILKEGTNGSGQLHNNFRKSLPLDLQAESN